MLQCRPLAVLATHFFTVKNLRLREDPQEWAAVAQFAGVDVADLLLVRQVHEASVALVSTDRPRPWPQPRADVVLSSDPAAAIAVRVADCVPVLLADDTGRAVAAVHAGWRGTARRAVIAAVAALQATCGVRPERLVAAAGPSIGPCCYEVGQDTREGFRSAGHHAEILEAWFARSGPERFHLDLWRATRDQLEGAGVLPQNIHVAELCTRTHGDVFHSYRIEGPAAGRMLGLVKASPHAGA